MLGAAVGLDCVGDTYPNSGRCCHECQPGNWMVSRCDHTRDTVCLPCDPGFYNEVVNYYTCKPCTQCNQILGLGVGLGVLAPLAALLALHLHRRAWRSPPGGNSFRTPIQEEHTDVHSTLAKI
ncbi:Tumor necrosis factor receptor superfamily member 4 [Tupaia chinensis]|uniref:Tumor necrosis factor receptor superfamily member 4 n=1 Tax=Tupaia chinensis TaxID=246437 RepID=L8Y950_TUPCH|nr:Tumor necrosis factor receptor superfamily member 4 [Tupaia chinensis]